MIGGGDKCGTTAGFSQHYRRGEKPCPACKRAKADYDRGRHVAGRRRRNVADPKATKLPIVASPTLAGGVRALRDALGEIGEAGSVVGTLLDLAEAIGMELDRTDPQPAQLLREYRQTLGDAYAIIERLQWEQSAGEAQEMAETHFNDSREIMLAAVAG